MSPNGLGLRQSVWVGCRHAAVVTDTLEPAFGLAVLVARMVAGTSLRAPPALLATCEVCALAYARLGTCTGTVMLTSKAHPWMRCRGGTLTIITTTFMNGTTTMPE